MRLCNIFISIYVATRQRIVTVQQEKKKESQRGPKGKKEGCRINTKRWSATCRTIAEICTSNWLSRRKNAADPLILKQYESRYDELVSQGASLLQIMNPKTISFNELRKMAARLRDYKDSGNDYAIRRCQVICVNSEWIQHRLSAQANMTKKQLHMSREVVEILSAIRMPVKYYPTLTSDQWYNGQRPRGTLVRKALIAVCLGAFSLLRVPWIVMAKRCVESHCRRFRAGHRRIFLRQLLRQFTTNAATIRIFYDRSI